MDNILLLVCLWIFFCVVSLISIYNYKALDGLWQVLGWFFAAGVTFVWLVISLGLAVKLLDYI